MATKHTRSDSSNPWIVAMFRVVQRGKQLGFALEASQAVGVGSELGRQHLDSHLAPWQAVVSYEYATAVMVSNGLGRRGEAS